MKTRMAENANIKENEIQKEIKKETGEEQKMLKNEYLSEINLDDRFELREIRLGEAVEAAGVEKACFPPSEACSEKMMVERATKAPAYFLVAVDRQTGKIAGILNGLATDETTFRDEFFTNAEQMCIRDSSSSGSRNLYLVQRVYIPGQSLQTAGAENFIYGGLRDPGQ